MTIDIEEITKNCKYCDDGIAWVTCEYCCCDPDEIEECSECEGNGGHFENCIECE